MRIVTYNIWNERKNFDKRMNLLIELLNTEEIDYLALQEVRKEKDLQNILTNTPFKYGYRQDGVAFLSKHKHQMVNRETSLNNEMIRVVNDEVSFTVVHYDWEHESNRMKGYNKTVGFIEENCTNIEFVLGDFNSSPESKLHFEMLMDDFHDLHQEYAHQKNEVPAPTLDFETNPRWRGKEVDEEPVRFDWIMLNSVYKYRINEVKLIGDKQTNGITPSDHYGVLVDIELIK